MSFYDCDSELDFRRVSGVKEFFSENLVWDEDTKGFINDLIFVQNKSLTSIAQAVDTINSSLDSFHEYILENSAACIYDYSISILSI